MKPEAVSHSWHEFLFDVISHTVGYIHKIKCLISADLSIEGAGVGLAHVQAGGTRLVCGGVGRAGPAGGLA